MTKKISQKSSLWNSQLSEIMSKNLVIVESPAKSKTIKKFLWEKFEVMASYWHISDLSKSGKWNLGVDIDNNFEPDYVISDDKKKVVSQLKKATKWCDKVRIATDEDREWEAIGRHVANALWLKIESTPRIVFHEITKDAITNAVSNPRTIDMNLVNAQQGRIVLDKIVWYKVSPVLRSKIKSGLSAGRVQSVAVKIIVEREKEINWFVPEETRRVIAIIENKEKNMEIELIKFGWKKINLTNMADFTDIISKIGLNIGNKKESEFKKWPQKWSKKIEISSDIFFELIDIITKSIKKSPPAPFTTSTLQQSASTKLWRWVKQVMSVAQKLYESWHITYMRTDSVSLSDLAIWSCKKFIDAKFGSEYSQIRKFKGKSKNAQEAHEAIRPSYIDKDSNTIWLDAEQKRLYDLIRKRTIASQMSDAIWESTTYIFCPQNNKTKQERVIRWEVITFAGWMKIMDNEKFKIENRQNEIDNEDEENENNENNWILPKLNIWEICPSKKVIWNQQFSKPPSRYTEASLVKALETKWIWRPSTYASIINTIQVRWYVTKKTDKKLHPSEIAFLVVDFLEKNFKDMMDYDFTAHLEEKLDQISRGEIWRKNMMEDFWKWFEKELENAGSVEKEKIYAGKNCPECQNPLLVKFSGNRKFVGCSDYPKCKYTENTKEDQDTLAPLKEKYEGKPCEAGGTIVVRNWRFGPFLSSSLYPQVKRIGKIPDEKINFLNDIYWWSNCEKCNKWKMVVKKKRWNSKNPYFMACDKYPSCKNAQDLKISNENMEKLKNIW